MIALGRETAGLFSNNDTLAKQLLASSKAMHEPMWQLPITQEHHDAMKSKTADLSNLGNTRYGGSCQAAAYLSAFVDKGVDWAHIDMAGPGTNKTPKPLSCGTGPGFGTQILLHHLKN